MHRRPPRAPRTEGRVLRRHAGLPLRWYDLFGTIVSFGRAKQIGKQLLALAAPAPGEQVLDVGCGTGTLALALKSSVRRGAVHGIDASPGMIDIAQRKAAKARAEIDFRVALIESLPFPDASFDLVTSSLMLHHLPEDLQAKGLQEIRRVLRPGGHFMVMDLATRSRSPFGHVLAFLGRSPGERVAERFPSMLMDAGFVAVEVVPTRYSGFAFVHARRRDAR